ncbi:MAG TPA: hypothetical protein VHW64_07715 [Nocardioides sp.]|jgi:hypothetical protein|uniref:hypothetical protein n=1 Tax=Nocardioides sp. TaxID=35761 RepID=UPI002E307DA5|nr:hypothetical protein [Nocardioides sp.]HEX3930574.1 hypothetical protein [Nocardioides sp.]
MSAAPVIPDPSTWGPRRYEVDYMEPYEMSIHMAGSSRPVSMVRNDDLGVILDRGQEDVESGHRVPTNVEDAGLVAVSIGVDRGDHDEVHYSPGIGHHGLTSDLLTQAIAALTAARDTLLGLEQLADQEARS